MTEQRLLCPNCRAENLPGALTCYNCNAKMPSAPQWVGPAKFRIYDAGKDRRIAYLFAIVGALGVVLCSFLAWLGVPKGAGGAANRGSSLFDIVFGAQGSQSAIGSGGVGASSVGADVRLVLAVVAVAAIVTLLVAIIKPLFVVLLICGLLIFAGPIYFFVQLAVRNNAQFNTPDLVSLLRLGFWGTMVCGLLIIIASFSYRPRQTYQSR